MSDLILKPFQPQNGGLLSVSIGTISGTSAQVAVPKVEGLAGVRLFNSGLDVIWVCFGTATTAVAVNTSMAMAPNSVEVFSVQEDLANDGTLYVAAIAAGASSNKLYITPGAGA
jgi:hypothetical protein